MKACLHMSKLRLACSMVSKYLGLWLHSTWSQEFVSFFFLKLTLKSFFWSYIWAHAYIHAKGEGGSCDLTVCETHYAQTYTHTDTVLVCSEKWNVHFDDKALRLWAESLWKQIISNYKCHMYDINIEYTVTVSCISWFGNLLGYISLSGFFFADQ